MLTGVVQRNKTGKTRSGSPDTPLPFDIIVTGVEVSLWVVEQFACDLQVGLSGFQHMNGLMLPARPAHLNALSCALSLP
jgi:hypothetical protein